jgi:(p)ppGpp synthase/HD superfamily hydrolase
LRLKSKYGPKITSVCWDAVPFQNFNAFIEVNGIDRKRMLLDIVQVISDRFDNNINHLDVSGVNGIFKAVINVSVKQANEVKNICDALSSIEGIDKVSRISHE